MNFLLHRQVATDIDGDPLMGVGAMLPDLWAMADRRIKPRRLESIAESPSSAGALSRGVLHHVRADAWFHTRPRFVENEAATRDALREAAQGEAKKIGLFAHIGWEMCLDGALVRRVGSSRFQQSLSNALEAVSVTELCELACQLDGRQAALEAGFVEGMTRIVEGLCAGAWVARYADGGGLVQLLAGVRRRFAFEPFSPAVQKRLSLALDERLVAADEALPALLQSCRSEVEFEPLPDGCSKW